MVKMYINISWYNAEFSTNAEIGVFLCFSHLSDIQHGQFPCVMIYTPQLNTRISDGIRPSAKYAMTNKRMRAAVQFLNCEVNTLRCDSGTGMTDGMRHITKAIGGFNEPVRTNQNAHYPQARHGTLRNVNPSRRHDLLSVPRRQDTVDEAL